MAKKWHDIPLDAPLLQNVQEAVLKNASAALENCFLNEQKGHSRFPGFKPFVTLDPGKRTYLHDWRGDLMAATDAGRLYRIDQNANPTNVTGVPISGGRRVIFAKTENELLMVAGRQPLRFAGEQTELLSDNTPDGTYIGYLDGYVLMIENQSERFWHSKNRDYRTWEDLDVFAADGQPDNLNGLVVTPYRELLLTGPDSIEQFERLPSGEIPFFRRWSLGEGVKAPYTLAAVDNGTWAVNSDNEFMRFSGQVAQSVGDTIGRTLEGVDDFTDAWATKLHIAGQKFILLQIPNATNVYGTKGITAIFDYRQNNWSNLYGWHEDHGHVERWPGWSYYKLWDRHFIGVEGGVFELDLTAFNGCGCTQRMLARTAHVEQFGESRCENIRMRIKRGLVGSNDPEPSIYLRVRKDNKRWTSWIRRGLGRAGKSDMLVYFGGSGNAHTHQFEYQVTADCEVEIASLQVQMTGLGR